MNAKQTERNEAIDRLKEILHPGDTVYTVLRHVSRSGMYRVVSVYAIADNEPRWLSNLVATAIGFRFDNKHDAVGVGGCGMDVGFEIVYNLSRVLFQNGDKADAGYLLKQRWM